MRMQWLGIRSREIHSPPRSLKESEGLYVPRATRVIVSREGETKNFKMFESYLRAAFRKMNQGDSGVFF